MYCMIHVVCSIAVFMLYILKVFSLCLIFRGHNELDDPSMTQPEVYQHIDSLTTVPDTYWEQVSVSHDTSHEHHMTTY